MTGACPNVSAKAERCLTRDGGMAGQTRAWRNLEGACALASLVPVRVCFDFGGGFVWARQNTQAVFHGPIN